MSIGAMKLALEALDDAVREWRAEMEFRSCIDVAKSWAEAAEALRAAIEQSQEPVAWTYPEGLEALKGAKPWVVYGRDGNGAYPDGVERFPLYLAPRLWHGLTEDDVKAPIQRAMQHFGYDPTQYSLGGMATIGFLGLVKEIEAKLKEKNT